MPRTNTHFKAKYNSLLDLLRTCTPATQLPTRSVLGARLAVSPATMRQLLHSTEIKGITAVERSRVVVVRSPSPADYFPINETTSAVDVVEARFLEGVSSGKFQPGDHIKEAEFARFCQTSTSSVREFLQRFSRYKLVEQRSGGGWTLHGFTPQFARELGQIREVLEIEAVHAFLGQRASLRQPVIDRLTRSHQAILDDIDVRYVDFRALDAEFHRSLYAATANRFFDDFLKVISFIYFYHYQWLNPDEARRVKKAVGEHIAILAAMRSEDREETVRLMRMHVRSSASSLLRSFERLVRPELT